MPPHHAIALGHGVCGAGLGLRLPRRAPPRHPQGNHHHRQRDQYRQPPEQRAPAHQRQGPLHWQRGGHHAERARHQHPRIRPHLRHRLQPLAVAGERRHQAGTDARAAQHAPGQQPRKPGGRRKHQAAHHGHAQEAERDLLGPVPVQPCSQRQLRGRKAQKVASRQQPQIPRVQRELLRQRGRQGGRDGAHQRRQEVGKGKRQKDDDGRPPRQYASAAAHRHGSARPAKNWSATSGRGLAV